MLFYRLGAAAAVLTFYQYWSSRSQAGVFGRRGSGLIGRNADGDSPSQLPAMCFSRNLWISALTADTHTHATAVLLQGKKAAVIHQRTVTGESLFCFCSLLPTAPVCQHLNSFHALVDWNQRAGLFFRLYETGPFCCRRR